MKDPLQEYAMLEKEKQQSDFEVWNSKKIKIMTAYAKKTEGKEVMIGGGVTITSTVPSAWAPTSRVSIS